MAFNIVSPGKEKSLLERMQALGVREQDIEEQFVRSSGAGGQKVNKTSSCVVLHHRPTGVRVKCQQERSQALNRFLARRILLDKIETKLRGAESAEQQEILPGTPPDPGEADRLQRRCEQAAHGGALDAHRNDLVAGPRHAIQ